MKIQDDQNDLHIVFCLLYHCLDRDPEHPFSATEQPFQDVGKEKRRKVGAYFFPFLCLYFECIYSAGHICEGRIHFFNVIRQWFGEKCLDLAVLAYFLVFFFHNVNFKR